MSTNGGGDESKVDALIAKYGKGRLPGYPCGVSKSEKGDLIETLNARGVQNQRIAEIIAGEFGLVLSAATIGRHIRKVCGCLQRDR